MALPAAAATSFATGPALSAPRGPAGAVTDVDETIWMTWYDLPEAGSAEYLSWLHGSYIPQMLRRPGYLWAAHFRRLAYPRPEVAEYAARLQAPTNDTPGLGRGSQYVLMFGADRLETFLPAPAYKLEAAEPETAREMLRVRQGVRSSVFRDAMRQNGPAVASRPQPGPPGPRIQLGSWQLYPGMEGEMWYWYLSGRYPQFRRVPGGISARTLIGLVGWAHSAILYEFETPEAHDYFTANFEGPGVQRYMANPGVMQPTKISLHAPGSPMYADRIWSATAKS